MSIERCIAATSLADFQHCFETPVAGCDCSDCKTGTEQSSAADVRESSSSASATPSATYSSADDDAYAEYLVQTGRDPQHDVTLGGRKPSPIREETMPTFSTFSEADEDEQYSAYLRATGRDPKQDVTLGNGSAVHESDEVLRHKVARGLEAEARLRQHEKALLRDEDAAYRAYVEQTGRDPKRDITLGGTP